MTNYELIRKAIKESNGFLLPEETDRHAKGIAKALLEIRAKEEERAEKKYKAYYDSMLLKESIKGTGAEPLKKQLQKTLQSFERVQMSVLERDLRILQKMAE